MLPGMTRRRDEFDSTTDSALVAELIAARVRRRAALRRPRPRARAREGAARASRAASRFVLMDDAHLIGVRDPHGFWPLVLGRSTGRLGARERDAPRSTSSARTTCATSSPARWSSIDASGLRASTASPKPDPRLCLFEFVYFARPDTRLYGQSVHAARQRMGEELARQAPVDADMVMPVPESGIPAAQGYARASGIPYGDGLVKNRYVGRTFIQPSQKMRGVGVRLKLNPLPREHPGQAPRGRRRLDRARHHDAPGRRDAARGRRGRGALPGVVAAVPVALLLRAWTPAGAASCSRPTSRSARSATTSASTRSPTSSSTGSRRHRCAAPSRSAPPASRRVPGAGARRTTPKLAARGAHVVLDLTDRGDVRIDAVTRARPSGAATTAHLRRRRRRHRGG